MINLINSITFDFSAVNDYAWTIFITGYVIVFTALISLSLLFRYLPNLINIKKPVKKPKTEKVETSKSNVAVSEDNEVYAAIAMAINLNFESIHDEESMVLTINRDSAINSPWSLKIHNKTF